MAKRRCAACGCLFVPRRNVPQQRYCSERACQRTRRRRWQRQKLKADADYRANQAAAQRRWRERHPQYWRAYRQRHPGYTSRNREHQRDRNRRRRLAATGPSPPAIANMDVCALGKGIVSGTYRLIPVTNSGLAKMDAYMVKMQVISAA
ncbi:MAG: hypothetical protein U9Q81_10245 [Pseudomonadota bacterium]|nr:hypothetical protein [Pseudomonadota bacterium]